LCEIGLDPVLDHFIFTLLSANEISNQLTITNTTMHTVPTRNLCLWKDITATINAEKFNVLNANEFRTLSFNVRQFMHSDWPFIMNRAPSKKGILRLQLAQEVLL